MKRKKWVVYLVRCCDGSYYTGVTNDVGARMKAHALGKGSKYVKGKGFGGLVAVKTCKDKSDACKKEHLVKKLSKEKKVGWFV